MRPRFITGIVCAALLIGLLTPFAAACPNCVDTISADASTGSPGTTGNMAGGIGGSMAAGYYYSILFMLTMLFTVTGIFVYVVYRNARAATQMTDPQSVIAAPSDGPRTGQFPL